MLSISKPMSPGQAGYYGSLAVEDYYQNGGEPPGIWLGTGAEELGLSGRVEKEDFHKVFNGFSPDGDSLTQNSGKSDRQCGWDMTFSAPKSVSVLWSQAPEEMRKEIQGAHFKAVEKAMKFVEENALFTRRGKGGESVESTNMIAAVFEHGTSRAQDPLLHSHALLLNLGVREDGSTGSVLSKPIFQLKMVLGAMYRLGLANELQENLGLEVKREKTWFELTAVPKELCEEMSKRRAEIEAKQPRSAVEAKAAALETRSVKEHVARNELFAHWKRVGKEHGWGEDQAREAEGRDTSKRAVGKEWECVEAGIRKLTESENLFTKNQLLRHALEEGQGKQVPVDAVVAAVRQTLEKSKLNVQEVGQYKGAKVFTTTEILDMEAELLSAVEEGKGNASVCVSKRTIEKAINSRSQLNSEQKAALQHITVEAGSIKAVAGMAGTGKSTMLSVAKEAWENEGFKVIGCAIAGKAADGLERGSGVPSSTIEKLLSKLTPPKIKVVSVPLFPDAPAWSPVKDLSLPALGFAPKPDLTGAGIKSSTIESLLQKQTPPKIGVVKVPLFPEAPSWSPAKKITLPAIGWLPKSEEIQLTDKTVLVVDEAGMVPTRTMNQLVQQCKNAGAKLVLVGDAKQLQPIEHGGPFGSIHARVHGKELTNIVRQKGWDNVATRLFADGHAGNALELMDRLGRVVIEKDRTKAVETLVRHWILETKRNPEKCLILAGTKEEVNELNRRAQEERACMGYLGKDCVRVGRQFFHDGDRVLFTKNDKSLGVMNGHVGSVTDVGRNRLTIRLENDRPVTVSTKAYTNLELGYAMTTHKAQGVTVDKTFVLAGGPMQDREMTYVQVSRAREGTWIYSDKDTAGEKLKGLAEMMEKSHQKILVHDVKAPDQGLEMAH